MRSRYRISAVQAAQSCRQTIAPDTDHSPFFSKPRQLAEFLPGAGIDRPA
jgi:hypothetical protein